ncbi:PDR/VanB family oxidoreductase [Arthrobacter sp. I2-34]|uniref:PDR/VanB family oxidoreductase n=1 Tax=Arthrobacter hankyongi TaxID=2904801 RepID=A0ABS9L764_9MICC|nr:PDR/VanB family oxidoreductase [Arthrobacter hankyongi]MCG2622490.1 PDR/VanB family oxidoreductase [Arthrobacter hankyongi]
MATAPHADFFDVEVTEIEAASDSVLALRLEHPQGDALPGWQPGAHVDVLLPNGLLRQYSLCSRPEDSFWRLGVLREPAGRGGSAWIHDELRPGTKLQVRGPRNNFALEPAGRYLFIAGGIGITPILPMVRQAEAAGADWTLLYLGRSRTSMAFRDELVGYGDRVRFHADDESGIFPLQPLLAGLDPAAQVYACGPAPLLNALDTLTADWSGRYHFERFTAAPEAAGAPAKEDTEFVVETADGTEITVPADTTILQALMDAGVPVLNSCREGICGTCETPVISGEIDHRDALLSDEERAAGDTMMICVSRCRGRRLVLDI